MPIQLSKLVLCGFAAGLISTQAHGATATVTAQVTEFTYRLIDRNLNDNITPSLTITGSHLVVGSEHTHQDAQYAPVRLTEYGSSSISLPYGTASATLAPDRALSTISLTPDNHGMRFNSFAEQVIAFVLSPHTELEITSLGWLSVDAPGLSEAWGFLSMNAVVWGYGGSPLGGGRYVEDHFLGQGQQAYRMTGTVQSDNVQRSGAFSFSSSVGATVTPVPEPSTYAMLLAGVLLIGTRSRRRST